MKHLLRKQIILGAIFLLLIFPSISQALEVGSKMPVIVLKNIDGKNIRLDAHRGVITFIHYNSETCRDLLIFLNKLDKKTQDLDINAVNLGPDNSGNLKKLSNKYGIKYDLLLDINLEATKAYQVLKLPTTFLINKSGNIQKVMIGFDQNIAEKIKSF